MQAVFIHHIIQRNQREIVKGYPQQKVTVATNFVPLIKYANLIKHGSAEKTGLDDRHAKSKVEPIKVLVAGCVVTLKELLCATQVPNNIHATRYHICVRIGCERGARFLQGIRFQSVITVQQDDDVAACEGKGRG